MTCVMHELTFEALQQQLAFKQKELDLLLAIDEIRDTLPEPLTMLTALVGALRQRLEIDLCAIALRDQETGELLLKAVADHDGQFGHLDSATLQELEAQMDVQQGVKLWQVAELPAMFHRALPGQAPHIATLPIFLDGTRLGILLFLRTHTPFAADDLKLMAIAESQVDSAVIQSYQYYTLQQKNKELETIYRVDNIRDRHLAFDDMLNAVLHEIRRVIQAEAGFIMLYNQAERLLELRAVANDDLFPVTPHYAVINRVANQSLREAKLICQDDLDGALRSLICLPLILDRKIIGVLGVINRYGRAGFDAEDRRLLTAIASQMDTAIFENLETRRLREVLGRSVDPRIMERLLASSEADFVNCERSTLTVLYADIRGSTALAEHTPPELLIGFINAYLSAMTDVIFAHEATLDKFVGDEVMALFGAPFPQPDHALRAIHVGLEMQQRHHTVMDAWAARGVERCPIGVGIATGELIVGEVGCRKRTDYTVIGRAANLGARLCGAAKGGEVIISQATYELAQAAVEVEPIHGVAIKGVGPDVTFYRVLREKIPYHS